MKDQRYPNFQFPNEDLARLVSTKSFKSVDGQNGTDRTVLYQFYIPLKEHVSGFVFGGTLTNFDLWIPT